MSERPTPETDALILSKNGFGATNYEWREHSRRLERERDEAREALSPKEYAATSKAKREGTKKGEQFVKQPKKIAAKTANYR